MRVRRVIAAALVSASALSGLAACTGDDKGSQPTTLPTVTGSASTSSSSASSSSAPTDEDQIVSQWKGYWTALLNLQAADDNTIKVELGKFAQPSQVNLAVEKINENRMKGLIQSGGLNFGKFAVSVDGASATVQECRDLSDLTVRDSAGAIVQQSPPDVLFQGNFSNVQGQLWAVDSVQVTQNQTCS